MQFPFPEHVPASTSSNDAKLHLLEKRLTGIGLQQGPDGPRNSWELPGARQPGTESPGAPSAPAPMLCDPSAHSMDSDVEIVTPCGSQGEVLAHITAAPSAAQLPAPITSASVQSGSKRRKTANPRQRMVDGSGDADVPNGVLSVLPANRQQSPYGGSGNQQGASAGAVARSSAGYTPKGKPQQEQQQQQQHQHQQHGAVAPDGNSNPMSPAAAERPPLAPAKTPRSASKQSTANPNPRGQKNISQYFPVLDGNSNELEPQVPQHQQQQPQQQKPQPQQPVSALPKRQRPAAASAGAVAHAALAVADAQCQTAEETVRPRSADQEARFRDRERQLTAQLGSSERHNAELQAALEQLQAELAESKASANDVEARSHAALCKLAQSLAREEGQTARLRLSMNGGRLGTLGVQRTGPMGFTEVWEDGQAFHELLGRQRAVQALKETAEAARKALKRRLAPPPSHAKSIAPAVRAASNSPEPSVSYISSADYVAQDEMLKVRLAALRRDEEALAKEEERLGVERLRQLRAVKRLKDEEGSRFGDQPLLNGRYCLMGLLGKGGFSEVYKAFDLCSLCFVAVKIHQLNSQWSEAKKSSYVRHAIREYNIHKGLAHPNIVSLSNIFEVDNNTFATVLELCEGGDLDTHLREHGALPEREARAILSQIFAGLAYLNTPERHGRAQQQQDNHAGGAAMAAAAAAGSLAPQRVIHYDLKPANILFGTLGEVKITDFGLSKVVEEGQTMGMELTSQGAGTYWYLPPECFEIGSAGPMGSSSGAPVISNKVDVWSAGVIFYQLLYGRRPFGEGLSQEQVLQQRVVLNARSLEFPPKPAVSAEAKEFMRRCLAHSQAARWDVLTAAADPYLVLKRSNSGGGGSGGSTSNGG